MAVLVSYLIVTYESAEVLPRTLKALARELEPGDEVVVWDNSSRDDTVTVAHRFLPAADVAPCPENLGFAAGANRAAARASGDLLVFLNPDAVPAPGFGVAIRAPVATEPGWGAWQGLVTMDRGRLVNTRGGVVHPTGLAWSGDVGSAVRAGEPRRRVGFASGACLAVRATDWRALGGFAEDFFMYCEDVDLSLRLRLWGREVGVEPAARVDHDYAFAKGPAKWRRLERNRWGVLIRCFPAPVLLAASPLLLAAEAGIAVGAVAGGWGGEKLRAWGDVLRALPRWRRERREIQGRRVTSATSFAAALTPGLDSPFLPAVTRSRPARIAIGAWWRLMRAAL